MTGNLFLFILPWVLPPIVGIVIGYVTNAIAIKMLFRPLKEIRILGIRLPFTPGIIPKQRYKLAESIGRMVSEQLITEEALRTRINSPDFQTALGKTICQATSSFLDTPLSRLKENLIPFIGDTFESLVNKLLKSFLVSKSFYNIAKKLLTQLLKLVTEKNFGLLVKELEIEEFLKEKLHTLINGDDFRNRLIKTVQNWIRAQISAKKNLSSFLPEELIIIISEVFKSTLPSLGNSLLGWLRQAPIRQELETKGRELVSKILEKLNLFQRLIVSIAQYDTALKEKMPEIIDDVIDYFSELLSDPEQQDRVVNVVKKAFLNWRKKDLVTLFGSSRAKIEQKIESLLKKFWQFLRGLEKDGVLFRKIQEWLLRQNSFTVGGLLHNLLGIREEQIVTYLLNFLTKEEFAERSAEKISSLLFDLTQDQKQVTLADFIGIDDPRRQEINTYLIKSVNSMLEARLPEMMRGLDIQGLVENKIDQLDVADVEALLLMVIAKHLKWINIFGGILGGLIGLSQLVLKFLKIN
jgi:uncharacterized membrane protein YheB (UPF0754 family)